ncbi:hypothetical protein FRC06_006062, partial [Ceratobasidium sp. 370]
CCAIIMATSQMLKGAMIMCKAAGIDVSAELLNIKAEDDDDSEDEDLPAVVPWGSKKAARKTAKGLYAMSIGIAQYLVTKGCLVKGGQGGLWMLWRKLENLLV